MSSTGSVRLSGVPIEYWLFSTTNTIGNFQMPASVMPSWTGPMPTAPSPMNTRVTAPSPVYFEANAWPAATGMWLPTIA